MKDGRNDNSESDAARSDRASTSSPTRRNLRVCVSSASCVVDPVKEDDWKPPIKCNLLQRWLHHRLRCHDIRLWVGLIEAAPTMLLARQIWERFTELPGQREQWQCQCGKETAAALRGVYFRVEATREEEEEE